MSTKPEAGQWWFNGILRRFVVGRTDRGIVVEAGDRDEHGLGYVKDDNWTEWHHEPRCTGWDWVVPEPAEDPDEWVIQDRVPVREGDRCWWVTDTEPLPTDPEAMWICYPGHWLLIHGSIRHGTVRHEGTMHVMCRRRDLPQDIVSDR